MANLEAAHKAAVVADNRTARAAAADECRSYIKATAHHLGARDRAAADLRKALEAAAAAWRILITRSEKAADTGGAQIARTLKNNHKLPAGSLTGFSELYRLVEAELFRVAGDPAIGNPRNFPGAKPNDIRFLNHPEAIRPLDETIADASKHVMAVLRGEKSEG